eukprot:6468444-Amphidinium_carterae.1
MGSVGQGHSWQEHKAAREDAVAAVAEASNTRDEHSTAPTIFIHLSNIIPSEGMFQIMQLKLAWHAATI